MLRTNIFFLVDFNRIVVGENEDYINAVAIQVGRDMYIILIIYTLSGRDMMKEQVLLLPNTH